MIELWNNKYSGKNYHYGTEPNEFFKEFIDKQIDKKLNILFPGDGEGRNSVYAAKSGHNVFAFDQSDTAKKKAINLAHENNVDINYEVSDVMQYYNEIKFDLIVMIYFHLPPDLRIISNRNFIKMLKKGGKIILEAFNKKQIHNNSGGPQNIDMLYSINDLKSDFVQLRILLSEEKKVIINEGRNHSGAADIIRFSAEK